MDINHLVRRKIQVIGSYGGRAMQDLPKLVRPEGVVSVVKSSVEVEPEVVQEPDTVVEPEVELPVVKSTTDVEVESEPVVELDVEVSVVKPSAEVEVESGVATEVELESIVEHEVEVSVVKLSTDVGVPVVDPEVQEVPIVDPEVQHTESIFYQVNVMQIALQTIAAAEESIETSPTTIPFEDTATVFDPSTEVSTQGEAASS
ncbi:unnamed protein product [Linum trigynum]|uniref:Uncharacterized protein n=1 Tax=Linum trigynum TaxID=586398 RepID=A0AAV2DDB6_9ROSI